MEHLAFDDFDEYVATLQDVDVRMAQTSAAVRPWSILELQTGPLHIQSVIGGSTSACEGVGRKDGWVFLMHSCPLPVLANGVEMMADDVMVLPPGAEFRFANPKALSWFSVFVPTNHLPASEENGESPPPMGIVISPDKQLAQQLRTKVSTFVTAVQQQPAVATDPLPVASFSEQTLRLLEKLLGRRNSSAENERVASSRHQLVSAAIELIEDCPDMSPTVRQLAHSTGVSERTLRSAFIESFGISPYQYLSIRRLNAARRLLREGDPESTSVSKVASGLGFWDFGRFAEKYRELIGELPSTTLRERR